MKESRHKLTEAFIIQKIFKNNSSKDCNAIDIFVFPLELTT